MRCATCVLDPSSGERPPLAAFLEQLAACDECPTLASAEATPLVQLLVGRHREAARELRGAENQVRKLKSALREATTEAEKHEERITMLERMQKASTRETEDALREQLELVRRQRLEMVAMSTPVIRVWRGVVVLPIIGALEEARAQQVTARLLDEVRSTGATHAIVDLTGLDEVDVGTAAHLIGMVNALRLLGARAILTGIRGRVAQTFIELGSDLSSVVTLGTLQEALRTIV